MILTPISCVRVGFLVVSSLINLFLLCIQNTTQDPQNYVKVEPIKSAFTRRNPDWAILLPEPGSLIKGCWRLLTMGRRSLKLDNLTAFTGRTSGRQEIARKTHCWGLTQHIKITGASTRNTTSDPQHYLKRSSSEVRSMVAVMISARRQ